MHGQLADGVEGAAVTVRVDGARRVAAGEALSLAVSPNHVHFFNPDNGKRMA